MKRKKERDRGRKKRFSKRGAKTAQAQDYSLGMEISKSV